MNWIILPIFLLSQNYHLGGSENKISLHEMGIVIKHLVPSLYAW